MKPIPSLTSLRLVMIATITLTMLVACETEPRRFTIGQGSPSISNVDEYLKGYRDSPEMFPREREMANREMELRYNWATRKAIENGKVRVRAIAPPLQLAGDDSVDMSTTHQVLLVADDLPAGQSFTNVYEVRVGPKDVLCTVRPAQASDTLANADNILIEEQLTRLRLDRQTLLSIETFAANFLPTAQARLDEAKAASTAHQSNLTALLKNKNDAFTEANNDYKSITNAFAATNAWIALSSSTNSAQLSAAKEKRTSLSNDKSEKEKQIAALKVQISDLQVLQTEDTSGLNSVQSVVENFKSGGKTASAGAKALTVLESFWSRLKTNKDRLSEISIAENRYSMTSAVTVSFRALALKGFREITIEVIRKTKSPPSPEKREEKAKGDDHLAKTLNELDTIQSGLKGFLQAEDRKIDPTNRRQMLNVQAGNLKQAVGKLEASILIRKHGEKTGMAVSGQPTSGKGKVAIRPPQATGESIIQVVGLEGDLDIALNEVKFNTLEIYSFLENQSFVSANQRQTMLNSVDKLKQSLGTSTMLNAHLIGLRGANRRATGPLDSLNVVASATVIGAGGKGEAEIAASDAFRLIENGDLAVFRLNVLRGVVSTTAFLLADDGASQLFGHNFADQFFVAQVTLRNPNDNPILVYGNTMRLVVRMDAENSGQLGEDGQLKRKTWWATYEPIDYDAVRRMLDSRQENSWQKWLSKTIDIAAMAGGAWVAFDSSRDVAKGVAMFAGILAPKLKDLLEEDLKRNAANFRDKGLNNIEEIPEQKTITRYVFLPKGPIYGSYAHDIAAANELPTSSRENRWAPFSKDARSFGNRALQPVYIHDIRREEVYVEGKRILKSDPLSATGSR